MGKLYSKKISALEPGKMGCLVSEAMKEGQEKMRNTGMKENVVNEICDLAKKHHVKKVILFGSRARGDYGRASDIDLAVCGGDIVRFALDVEEETSTPLRYDVVNLDENIQEGLRRTIGTEGMILYEKI